MRIVVITPALPKSRAGNRATATRWANIFKSLGHSVHMVTKYDGYDADLMIALHAWRSADAVQLFAESYPGRPIIVAITGTDGYQYIHSHRETTLRSIHLADHLVGLHELISNTLPPDQRHKMQVICQSAQMVSARHPYQRYFHVSVLGHLRHVKDPLRPALAARYLPANSRIQVHHYGQAHSPEWADKAKAEMAINPRYFWHQEVAHYQIRRVYQRTNLLVLPSRMEGGANVISEALIAGVPVIASQIEGSVGLLGKDYGGYYPVEDEQALAALLQRAENDPDFYQQLQQQCQRRRFLFLPQREKDAWATLLMKFNPPKQEYS
ncbi:MAG: putative glycosyltransferase (TIGR04348 family) [Phenylobacterium sp.]|jgi:putative glycosyltransferase (TIGR04348 family)